MIEAWGCPPGLQRGWERHWSRRFSGDRQGRSPSSRRRSAVGGSLRLVLARAGHSIAPTRALSRQAAAVERAVRCRPRASFGAPGASARTASKSTNGTAATAAGSSGAALLASATIQRSANTEDGAALADSAPASSSRPRRRSAPCTGSPHGNPMLDGLEVVARVVRRQADAYRCTSRGRQSEWGCQSCSAATVCRGVEPVDQLVPTAGMRWVRCIGRRPRHRVPSIRPLAPDKPRRQRERASSTSPHESPKSPRST